VALGERWLTRRPLRLSGLPLLVCGYALYRLCGRYRLERAGGPPGLSQGMPQRLVTEGPYRWCRNPMYAGHLVFLAGIAATTRSPSFLAVLAAHVPWFRARVTRDERRLEERFGAAYEDYYQTVPRWLPVRRRTRCPSTQT
jgi:protein-S-isoprenylcysteine O-methyltransferase Ste14